VFLFVFLPGTLTVSPSSGTAVDTQFTLRAGLFTDDLADYPLKYKFGFYAIEDGKEVKRYLGLQNARQRKRVTLAQGLFHRQARNPTFLGLP